MQEEVNEKTVSLCITGGKVTARLLKQAMMRFLAAMEKEKAEKARKQQVKGPPDKDYHGKQSLKKLAQQNVQLSNIEITDNNIKTFEKVAKKYGIDFSLKRDTCGIDISEESTSMASSAWHNGAISLSISCLSLAIISVLICSISQSAPFSFNSS